MPSLWCCERRCRGHLRGLPGSTNGVRPSKFFSSRESPCSRAIADFTTVPVNLGSCYKIKLHPFAPHAYLERSQQHTVMGRFNAVLLGLTLLGTSSARCKVKPCPTWWGQTSKLVRFSGRINESFCYPRLTLRAVERLFQSFMIVETVNRC